MRASDAGRYSCLARNDTTTLEGDITLAVIGKRHGSGSRCKLLDRRGSGLFGRARRVARHLK